MKVNLQKHSYCIQCLRYCNILSILTFYLKIYEILSDTIFLKQTLIVFKQIRMQFE